MIICFICLSLNFTYASDNETEFDQDIISSSADDAYLPEVLNQDNSINVRRLLMKHPMSLLAPAKQ